MRKIIFTQDLETRQLEAYYGRLLLWSKMPTEPGSPEEAVEFYTYTLIALLMRLEQASNHQRIAFFAEADGVSEAKTRSLISVRRRARIFASRRTWVRSEKHRIDFFDGVQISFPESPEGNHPGPYGPGAGACASKSQIGGPRGGVESYDSGACKCPPVHAMCTARRVHLNVHRRVHLNVHLVVELRFRREKSQ